MGKNLGNTKKYLKPFNFRIQQAHYLVGVHAFFLKHVLDRCQAPLMVLKRFFRQSSVVIYIFSMAWQNYPYVHLRYLFEAIQELSQGRAALAEIRVIRFHNRVWRNMLEHKIPGQQFPAHGIIQADMAAGMSRQMQHLQRASVKMQFFAPGHRFNKWLRQHRFGNRVGVIQNIL
ncbi:MAG: hypothetical protein BWY65_01902 [Firmicutes bacterium ADurb.Bin373]|nr:MAG: hypothetical protein BWY65_01902 [Firmicutes bacterium ADurb.Bin373]